MATRHRHLPGLYVDHFFIRRHAAGGRDRLADSRPAGAGRCDVFPQPVARQGGEAGAAIRRFQALQQIAGHLPADAALYPTLVVAAYYSRHHCSAVLFHEFLYPADDPSLLPRDVLERSKKMMYGYKSKLFGMCILFLLLSLLCILTLGIGFLWLIPHANVTMAKFYEDIRDKPQSL